MCELVAENLWNLPMNVQHNAASFLSDDEHIELLPEGHEPPIHPMSIANRPKCKIKKSDKVKKPEK